MTAWALDLDGVVWLADEPIGGSAAAVHALVVGGEPVVLVSNNSAATVGDYRSKLERMGLPAGCDLVTSAMAAASLVESGERAVVCGGPGIAEALTARGAVPLDNVTDHDAVDVVVVGFHRDFDYERLRRAASAVRAGARLIATNDDATYPIPGGVIPGGGAILAAVERASGVTAVVAGKPYAPIVEVVRGRYGAEGTMVGDRPDTDGRFARALGWRFALVLSGVTSADDLPVEPEPDVVAPSLASLVG
jgi:4-nitrophenyl phosphatase